MKKIIYSLIFLLFIFFGINEVLAENEEVKDDNSYEVSFFPIYDTWGNNDKTVYVTFIKYDGKNYIKWKINSSEQGTIVQVGDEGISFMPFPYVVINIPKNQVENLFEVDSSKLIIRKQPKINMTYHEPVKEHQNEIMTVYEITTTPSEVVPNNENSFSIEFKDMLGTGMDVTVTFIKERVSKYIKFKIGNTEYPSQLVTYGNVNYFSTSMKYNSTPLKFIIMDEEINKIFSVDDDNKIIRKSIEVNYQAWPLNNFILSTLSEELQILAGDQYRRLVCELYPYLNAPNTKYNQNYEIVGHRRINFDGCSGSYQGEDLEYYTSMALTNLGNYCNKLYSIYNKYKNQDSDNINKRVDECIDFDVFYNNLVKNKIVNNLGSDCPFISGALKEKIVWVFNLIKIAGPILAIGLGSIDFIKVIVSGEADKEIKKAGQSFLKRFIAAVLLFIIPIILAWAIDLIFETGGFKDNPFCNTVDWSKIK